MATQLKVVLHLPETFLVQHRQSFRLAHALTSPSMRNSQIWFGLRHGVFVPRQCKTSKPHTSVSHSTLSFLWSNLFQSALALATSQHLQNNQGRFRQFCHVQREQGKAIAALILPALVASVANQSL